MSLILETDFSRFSFQIVLRPRRLARETVLANTSVTGVSLKLIFYIVVYLEPNIARLSFALKLQIFSLPVSESLVALFYVARNRFYTFRLGDDYNANRVISPSDNLCCSLKHSACDRNQDLNSINFVL